MAEDPNKITYFAKTNSRGKETPFGIKRRDRARHMYVIGKTGMGKSTLLENMAIQDIRNGESVAFIDPHGSTADRLLEYVPEHRIQDVLYFAPFDMEYPVAFNVMEDVGYDKRHLVVSGLLSAFRKIWVDAWSARMEYILSNTLLALLEYPGSTLLDVNRMLVNKNFRKKVVDNVTDPIVKSFWVDEFANYTDRYTQDATPAIQNKVGQFTSNPLIRNIVGQPKSSFDIRKLMDDKKILIMNLSKGRVGEVNATLLGSMLVTKIYLAAMSRADVPATTLAQLPNFYFYVDEFQNFANQSFADILSEARKYKLNLIIAHQYVEQMEEEVRDAVFGNVGTTIAFRVGPFDAEVLETIFKPQFTHTDLVNLGVGQIYLTLMIDGVGSPPFSASSMPAFDPPPQKFVEQVIASSRNQFGKPRPEVEELMAQWQVNEVDSAPPASGNNGKRDRQSAPRPRTEHAEHPRSPGSSFPLMSDYEPRERSAERSPRPRLEHTQERTPQPAAAAHQPVHEAPAQQLGERLAHQHTLAVSAEKQEPEPRTHQEHRPARERQPVRREHGEEREQPMRSPVPQKMRPPLEGSNSLKDALRQAMSAGAAPKPQAPQPPRNAVPQHAPAELPDLKATLRKIVAEQPATPREKLDSAPATTEPAVKQREATGAPSHKAAQLPDDVLRSMLAVDEGDIQS